MKRYFSLLAGGLLCLGLVGCDVDVREEGEMPDVEVREGQMPEMDVHGPEVETGEKQVTVPTFDVNVPEEEENEPVRDAEPAVDAESDIEAEAEVEAEAAAE